MGVRQQCMGIIVMTQGKWVAIKRRTSHRACQGDQSSHCWSLEGLEVEGENFVACSWSGKAVYPRSPDDFLSHGSGGKPPFLASSLRRLEPSSDKKVITQSKQRRRHQ